MAFTSLSNVYDPIKIMAIIGEEWTKMAVVIKSGIAKLLQKPVQGTLTYALRVTRFQDISGQAIAAGGTISTQNRTQTKVQHPVIWRYFGADEPNVIEEIVVKDVPGENASMAAEIQKAATQIVDDSTVATLVGVGASNTGNQSDQSGSVITLVSLIKGFSTLNEKGMNLKGGGIAMNSAVYYKLVELGLVAATSNTFGNELQTGIVRQGVLPENIVGMTPLVSDKFTAVTANNYYLYFLGKDALVIRGNDTPEVKVADKTALKEMSTVTLCKVGFGIGIDGMSWSVTGKENVTDTELQTNTSWTLAAANAADVKLSRVKIKIA